MTYMVVSFNPRSRVSFEVATFVDAANVAEHLLALSGEGAVAVLQYDGTDVVLAEVFKPKKK